MDYKLMGQKIRLHRQQQRLTQAKLAEMVSVSTSFIGHVEHGSRKASLETLEGICRALSISMDEVAMPPIEGLKQSGYSDEQISRARSLLEIALEMCK